MKTILRTLFISIFSLISISYNAQIEDFGDLSKYSFREKFEMANSLTLVDLQYDMALPIWENLIQEQPDNANLNYKLGFCILHSSINRHKSLPYLEKAKSSIASTYSHFDFDEKNVPKEILFYLSKSYHLNYKLDEAQQTFNTFIAGASKKHTLNDASNLGITQCDVARKLVASPKSYIIKNIGQTVNSTYSDFGPATTADDKVLFFTSRRLRKDSANIDFISPQDGKYFEDVYVTHRSLEDGSWKEPEVIETISNPRKNEATISVSADGKWLFVYVDDEGDGNIYISEINQETGEYSRLQKLEDKINTTDWETHATISRDGTILYFVSDREGGYGGRDIYKVVKNNDGTWGDVTNLGTAINTKYDEESPFFHPDNNTLFFSSNGEASMGGFDIFYSELKQDGSWSTPINMGYPLNTVDDDVFLITNPSGKRGYYSSAKDGGYGEKDIYEIYLDTSYTDPLAVVKGYIIQVDSNRVDAKVLVTNLTTGVGPDVYYPRKIDDGYIIILDPCNNYLVEYVTGNEIFHSETFKIPCDTVYYEIERNINLNKQVLEDSLDIVIDSAEYQKYFGYNKHDISTSEEKFMEFISKSKNILAQDKGLFITIEGSASWVPTRTFGNNQKLAKTRAEDAKTTIMAELEKQGVNLNFVRVDIISNVNGPKYEGDFQNTDKYGPFQYVKVKAEIKGK
ncbi:MAG: TolB family protein [Bacteroidia bacterium]